MPSPGRRRDRSTPWLPPARKRDDRDRQGDETGRNRAVAESPARGGKDKPRSPMEARNVRTGLPELVIGPAGAVPHQNGREETEDKGGGNRRPAIRFTRKAFRQARRRGERRRSVGVVDETLRGTPDRWPLAGRGAGNRREPGRNRRRCESASPRRGTQGRKRFSRERAGNRPKHLLSWRSIDPYQRIEPRILIRGGFREPACRSLAMFPGFRFFLLPLSCKRRTYMK